MSVNPLDRTDQRLIQLVATLGDPTVDTQDLTEEVSLGFEATRERLETLEDQGWVVGQRDDGQWAWQVSSKAGLLVRTDAEPPTDEPDEDIIKADESAGAESSDDSEDTEGS